MGYIEDVARDALQMAGSDVTKARRTLILVAGILALIHVLTVYPYLQTSHEIADVEKNMAENTTLLARLDPEIQHLKEAGERVNLQLTDLLDGVTADMIQRFADLRMLVEDASRGGFVTAERPPAPEVGFSPPMQQMLIPQGNDRQQLQIQQIDPAYPGQYPPPESFPGQATPADRGAITPPSDLRPILDAIVAGELDAYDRLTNYARSNIVAASYERAERDWSGRIRPAYVDALATAEGRARQGAEHAPQSAGEIASALTRAADEMARQRAAVEAIEIRHDAIVDAALGTDWWRTVEGKGAYADAVGESIDRQMREIAEAAEAPMAAIREALALQEQLREALQNRQQDLEEQFADQRQQLAALSGTSGVVPVDLATFIGVFPLVLGLALGFMLLRAGQARRQAALAAEDLARAAPDDRDTRGWLARRALGGGTVLGPLGLTAALAIGAAVWIGLAAMQVDDSPVDPPLSAWTSGSIAILLVIVAAIWDGVAIRRLAANLQR